LKKEEGAGLYMGIQDPNSKRATCVLVGVLKRIARIIFKPQINADSCLILSASRGFNTLT
jgi:hypothetical protein